MAHTGLCPQRNPPGTHCQRSWELTKCPVFTSCLNFGFVEASTPNLWKNLVNKGGRDLSTGPGVESLPANKEDTSSIPGWGTRIPRAAGQLSLRAAARNRYSQINKYLKTTTTRERNQESNTKLSRLPVLRQLEKTATHRSLCPYYFQSGGGGGGVESEGADGTVELLTSCSRTLQLRVGGGVNQIKAKFVGLVPSQALSTIGYADFVKLNCWKIGPRSSATSQHPIIGKGGGVMDRGKLSHVMYTRCVPSGI